MSQYINNEADESGSGGSGSSGEDGLGEDEYDMEDSFIASESESDDCISMDGKRNAEAEMDARSTAVRKPLPVVPGLPSIPEHGIDTTAQRARTQTNDRNPGSQRLATNNSSGSQLRPSDLERSGRGESGSSQSDGPNVDTSAANAAGTLHGMPQNTRNGKPVDRDVPAVLQQRAAGLDHQFRLQGKNFFFTWPQVQKQFVAHCTKLGIVSDPIPIDRLRSMFVDDLKSKGFTSGCISTELHSDGTDHFHAFCRSPTKKNLRGYQCLDLRGVHGRYEPARDTPATVSYVCKHDNYEVWGVKSAKDLCGDARVEKRNREWDEIGDLVQQGKSAQEIVTARPARFRELRKIEEAVMANSLWQLQVEKKKSWGYATVSASTGSNAMDTATTASTTTVTPDSVQNLHSQNISPNYEAIIVEWLNKNIGQVRKFRQKQLYLYGPPRCGKTSLIEKLRDFCRIYIAPYDGEWWDTYDDNSYDLIVFDDYKHQYKIQLLNQILDGSQKPLSRRGRAPILKKRNLPCIFLSNWPLENNYNLCDESQLAPLKDRLLEVEVRPFINIHIYEK